LDKQYKQLKYYNETRLKCQINLTKFENLINMIKFTCF